MFQMTIRKYKYLSFVDESFDDPCGNSSTATIKPLENQHYRIFPIARNLPEATESDISIGVAVDVLSKSALEKFAQLSSSSPVEELGTLSQGLPASIATGIF